MGRDTADRTATHDRDEATPDRAGWARLCVVHPASHAAVIELDEGTTTVGRESSVAGVGFAHPTVSRRHFELRRERHTVLGLDLGSHNGSRINRSEAGGVPRALHDGDVVRLGEVVAVLEIGRDAWVDSDEVSREAIPGESAAAARLRARVGQVARDPSPVLLLGSSGTGKESTARELHRLSARSGPLITTNCATLSATLIESQLFGHERGAFTGSVGAHAGLFRQAHGGTLFLDEIGELALESQPKLLRAVELGEVTPLGGATTHSVDTRIIAATNRDITGSVETGTFRRDLYARLSLFKIELPALDRRRADLMTWIRRLHRRWSETRGILPPTHLVFSAEAVETILLHRWRENLRGLDQLVHELGTGSETAMIGRPALPSWLLQPSAGLDERPPPRARQSKPDREELVAQLCAHDYNVSAVAAIFGRDRKQIYRWITAFGIELKR